MSSSSSHVHLFLVASFIAHLSDGIANWPQTKAVAVHKLRLTRVLFKRASN